MNSVKHSYKKNTLRTRLIVSYQLLVVFFILIVSGFSYLHERSNHIEATFQKLETVAVLKERTINSWMVEEKHLAAHFANMPGIKNSALVLLNPEAGQQERKQAQNRLMKQLKNILHEIPDLGYVSILSRDGRRSIVSTDENKSRLLGKASGIKPLDHVAIQSIRFAPALTALELVVTAPILTDSGDRAGLIYFSLKLDYLLSILHDLTGLQTTGQTYLVDDNGRLLSGARDQEYNLRLVQMPPMGKTNQHREGTTIFKNYKNKKVLAYYRWIDTLKVSMVAEIEWQEALIPLTRFTQVMLMVTIFIIALAFLIAVVLARQITEPIIAVADTAKKMSQGDLSLRVQESDLEELSRLSSSFNNMANVLQSSFREKDMVYQQTKSVNARLQAATSAKNVFLANMSHELRTPLNAIIGYSELLKEEAEENQLQGLVDDFSKIQNAGHHLLALINDILDVAKIEEGKIELHYEEICINDFVNSIYSVTQLLVKKNRNRLYVSCPDNAGTMVVDMTRLKQSLINLVSNAAKFTKQGDIHFIVQTTIRDDIEWISFSVKDTGVGIARDKISKIFEQFSQADSSTTKEYGGTGLGLTLAKQFVELMQGSLKVSSEKGKGAVFTVTLPMAPHSMLVDLDLPREVG